MSYDLDEKGSAVTKPFTNIGDVINWKPDKLLWRSGNASQVTSPNRLSDEQNKRTRPNQPQVLVCHDMCGGYLDDRFIQGCPNDSAYRFYHWHLIDTFVYFSHHFVTIPPTGWIKAAHKHGVSILGTLITEWDDGAEICKELLKSKRSIDQFTTKLADMALLLGFDGWLINIENKIEADQVPQLQLFVQQLTTKCQAVLPASEVLWYDSVISTGELKWQDELNSSNEMFFGVSDGIYLNYNITEEKLARSKALASASNRQFDVYVGIDVFGRGTPGGGGFNCIETLKMIFDQGLSCAIFAPGWVYEHFEKENFDSNEVMFWGILRKLLMPRPLTVPFTTSFCQGYGKQLYKNGQVSSDAPWHNLGVQQLQPSFSQSQFVTYSILKVKEEEEDPATVQETSMAENSSNVQYTTEGETTFTAQDTTEGESTSTATDTTEGETTSTAPYTMVGENTTFMPDTTLADKTFPAHDYTSGEYTSAVQDTTEGENTSTMQDTTDGENASTVQETVEVEKKIKFRIEANSRSYHPARPVMNYDTSDGYLGGGCLNCSAIDVTSSPVLFRIFKIRVTTQKTLNISVTWKISTDVKSSFMVGLVVSTDGGENKMKLATVCTGVRLEDRHKKMVTTVLAEPGTPALKSVQFITSSGMQTGTGSQRGSWITSDYTVDLSSLTKEENLSKEPTLSAILIPTLQQTKEASAENLMSVKIGHFQVAGDTSVGLTTKGPLITDFKCLEAAVNVELSTKAIEDIMMNSLFNDTNVSLLKRGTAKGLQCGEGNQSSKHDKPCAMDIDTVSAGKAGSSVSVIQTAASKHNLTLAGQDTSSKLDTPYTLYVLRWRVMCEEVDYFLLYHTVKSGKKSFIGHAITNCFVYKHCDRDSNIVSFSVQPVLTTAGLPREEIVLVM